MKIFLYLISLICGVILLFSACEPEEDKATPPVMYENIRREYNPVKASVVGRIVDENHDPVDGATVYAGSSSVQTDVNGNFRLDNAILDKTFGSIRVEKEGFFNGIRTFSTHAGEDNEVEIQLIRKTIVGTFSSQAGGQIAIGSSGASLNFPASAVVNAQTGQTYSGAVSVSAFYLNPEEENFGLFMPGNLMALDSSSSYRTLQSFGMLVVEMEGASGEKLQLDPNKPATIHSPIPQSLLEQAPEIIPLWHFDEESGLWIEEGSAKKEGDKYVGKVSHFSFWNCDAPFPIVKMNLTVKTSSGVPVANAQIEFIIKGPIMYGYRQSGFGQTDSKGQASGMVPVGKELTLKITNKCGDILFEKDYPAMSGDFGITAITNPLGLEQESQISFSGAFTACNDSPIRNGAVYIDMDGRKYAASVINGKYQLSVLTCVNAHSVKLYAVNFENMQSTPETTLSLNNGLHNLDFNICSPTDTNMAVDTTTISMLEYVNIQIGTNSFVFIDSNENGTLGEKPLHSHIHAYMQDHIAHVEWRYLEKDTFFSTRTQFYFLLTGGLGNNGYTHAFNMYGQYGQNNYVEVYAPQETVNVMIDKSIDVFDTSNVNIGTWLEGHFYGIIKCSNNGLRMHDEWMQTVFRVYVKKN